MRLRYLRVRNLPPLEDVAITFGHEPALGRDCAIHFVVGVNGSGKSRLLQTLTDVLLHLEAQRLPPYPVALAYDLGSGDTARTIYLWHCGEHLEHGVLVHFERIPDGVRWADIEEKGWKELTDVPYRIISQFKGNELPGEGSIGAYLPSVLLAYTSGATTAWEDIFAALQIERRSVEGILFAEAITDVGEYEIHERPANWDKFKEMQSLSREEIDKLFGTNQSPSSPGSVTQSIGLFVPPHSLRLAIAAVAIVQFVKEYREALATNEQETQFTARINQSLEDGKRMPGLRGIMNEVDWLWPVTISLRVSFQPERLTPRKRDELQRLYRIATSIIRDPEPGRGRQLFFDLRRPLPDSLLTELEIDSQDTSTAAALMRVLGGEQATPLSIFTRLRVWQADGLLEDTVITLRKRNLENLLPYDWLSDGERVFLGRMALFHLLRAGDGTGKSDALVLLDEPETHFNDLWKREIVDIIDDSIGEVASNVVITTHSSIALTDVFDNEITLLTKSASDGQVEAARSPVRSFGASPSEIMRDLFGAPDSVGQRAAKFLDMVLAAAANPEQVEAIWRLDGNETAIKASAAFQQLRESVRESAEEMEHNYGNDEQLDRRLLNMLNSLRDYAREGAAAEQSKVAGAINVLENRLGAGYYQFEFRRRLRALRGRTPDAASD